MCKDTLKSQKSQDYFTILQHYHAKAKCVFMHTFFLANKYLYIFIKNA